MGTVIPPGPYRMVGRENPFYILQFDKRGGTTAPETLAHAHRTLRIGDFTDVFVFCHGWNNDWEAATDRYNHFVDGFIGQAPDDPARRALLMGIFWPSALLVMPGEQAPAMAAEGGLPPDFDAEALADVTEQLDVSSAARVERLARWDELHEQEATELAELLAPVYGGGVEELGEDTVPPSPHALAASWRAGAPVVTVPKDEEDNGDWGTADEAEGGPQAAGLLDKLNPRDIIRGASVWVMKDRAGRVGVGAVGPLVRAVLADTDARVHLVGHSFGAKVALSAICAEPLPRSTCSLLLLQPAINHLCFAESVPGRGRPGGYRSALERVERPIFSTYSAHDLPLTRFFHWALRREADIGEPKIAAWPDPPSDYAALGGYGPHGADRATQRVTLNRPSQPYSLDLDKPLAAVDATAGVSGHSDVSNPFTWWALRELAA